MPLALGPWEPLSRDTGYTSELGEPLPAAPHPGGHTQVVRDQGAAPLRGLAEFWVAAGRAEAGHVIVQGREGRGQPRQKAGGQEKPRGENGPKAGRARGG